MKNMRNVENCYFSENGYVFNSKLVDQIFGCILIGSKSRQDLFSRQLSRDLKRDVRLK
jgi:hypothetical protein